MVTYDSTQVRSYADEVHKRLDDCMTGEGMDCADLEKRLMFFAGQCWGFIVEMRHWARDIFRGRIAYDEAAEKLWLAELEILTARAFHEWEAGAKEETECFELGGVAMLESALWRMGRLKSLWVTPGLASGPSARRKPSDDAPSPEVKERLKSLPPHPKEWMPRDKQQAARYKMMRGR